MRCRKLISRLGILSITLLTGGFLGASLVRFGPGFDTDEQELDPRLSAESIARIRQARAGDRDLPRFYFRYLTALMKGDLGTSRSLGRPVSELLRERLPVTLRAIGIGLSAGWAGGLLLALFTHFWRIPGFDFATTLWSGVFLCLPAAVLALMFVFIGAPAPLGIAAVIFPRVFRYARNLFLNAVVRPHVITARAKGLGKIRILLWHILPCIAPELLALLGVSISLAFTASIPVEAICDSPGIGQLAWQAALARDLPLLTNLTLIVAAVTLGANLFSGWNENSTGPGLL